MNLHLPAWKACLVFIFGLCALIAIIIAVTTPNGELSAAMLVTTIALVIAAVKVLSIANGK